MDNTEKKKEGRGTEIKKEKESREKKEEEEGRASDAIFAASWLPWVFANFQAVL